MSHVRTLRSDLWQARAALLSVIALQWAVEGNLHVIGRRLRVITLLEVILLICLTMTSERHVRRAQPTRGPAVRFIEGEGGLVRTLALSLIAFVSVINLWGLLRLIQSMVESRGAQAPVLLAEALFLFATNVVICGVWYWELDRGGPYRRASTAPCAADFLFPQMTLDGAVAEQHVPKHWLPRFGDYLYVAFTNATAFSPTDTLPLTRPAKLLMAFQASVSLLTLALVAARAVNILAQ